MVSVCCVFTSLAAASEMATVKINDHKPPTGNALIYPNQTVIISVTIASDREVYRVNRTGLDESFFEIVSEQSEAGAYRIELRAREDKRGVTEVVLDILDAAGEYKGQKTVSFNILEPQEMHPRITSPSDKELDKRVTFKVETGIGDSELNARKVKIAWTVEGDAHNEKAYYKTFSGNGHSQTLEKGVYNVTVLITDELGYEDMEESIFEVEDTEDEGFRTSKTVVKKPQWSDNSVTIDFGDTPEEVTWNTPFILDLRNCPGRAWDDIFVVNLTESDGTFVEETFTPADANWKTPSIMFKTSGNRSINVKVYDACGRTLKAQKTFYMKVKPTYYNSSQEGTEAENFSEGFEKNLEEESQGDASQENIFERLYHEGVRLIKDAFVLYNKI